MTPPVLRELAYCARHKGVRAVTVMTALALAIAVAVGVGFARPAAREAAVLQHEIDLRRQHLDDDRSRVALARAAATARRLLPAAEQKLDKPLSQATIIREVRKLAGRHRLRIGDESFARVEVTASRSAIAHELDLVGSYRDTTRFLAAMVTLPVFTVVDELRMEPANGKGHPVKTTLRLLTYGAPGSRDNREGWL